MPNPRRICRDVLLAIALVTLPDHADGQELSRLKYNHPGLVVDLGVGLWAWPLPMDFDGDGDLDLVLSSPDKPFNGTYFFENRTGRTKMPVFEAPRRISQGLRNVQVSYVGGQAKVLGPGREYHQFTTRGLDASRDLAVDRDFHEPVGTKSDKTRAQQWKYCDYDADGDQDLIVGIGDWSDYGWDDAYDQRGHWTNGPLHGFVYWIANEGDDRHPKYDTPELLRTADGRPIDVFGWPSPNLADFDGDGDLDLLCGEFLDSFTYFQNVGTRSDPLYRAGRRLRNDAQQVRMDLQMIVPVAIDWDEDGDLDLVVGDEDGRVALVEHAGSVKDGLPVFRSPVYFRQKASLVKCGALSTPCGFDWDGDGDDDILSGNTAGYLEFFENLGIPADDASATPRWNAPQKLNAAGKVIRIQAGPNGSIQGPCEAKWGYTTLTAGDWNHDGLPDLVVNSIWGKVIWFRNEGTRKSPRLSDAQPIEVQWLGKAARPDWNWWAPNGNELVTQWRTTPVIVDWNRDGLNDLLMLDHEGYLALYARQRRDGGLLLMPPQRIFVDTQAEPIRLNPRRAGGSGRRKLSIVDWDGDGMLDVLVNSKNADWLRAVGRKDGTLVLRNEGPLASREISSHTTSPTTVDFNRNGVPDLLVGAEDGHFYYMPR